MTVIRAAITQTTWTGDKQSMLDKHEQFAREAKAQQAEVICFQELFYGPYFGITEDAKYYEYAEPADGPIVQRFALLPCHALRSCRLPCLALLRTTLQSSPPPRSRRSPPSPPRCPNSPQTSLRQNRCPPLCILKPTRIGRIKLDTFTSRVVTQAKLVSVLLLRIFVKSRSR